MKEKDIPRYVSDREVARILEFSRQKLALDRHMGRGLPFVRIGRNIRYDLKEILTIVEAGHVRPSGGK